MEIAPLPPPQKKRTFDKLQVGRYFFSRLDGVLACICTFLKGRGVYGKERSKQQVNKIMYLSI